MAEIPNINLKPFDNELSILYKWAYTLGIPAKYIAVRPATPEDVGKFPITRDLAFEPLDSIINTYLQDLGNTLPTLDQFHQLYNQLHQMAEHLSFSDIILLIYSIATGKNLDRQALFDLINRLFVQIEVEQGGKIKNYLYLHLQNLDNAYALWYEEYQKLLKKDEEILLQIINIQDILDDTVPLPISPLTIDGVTVQFTPRVNHRPVQITDGIDIFNAALLSPEVPYLQYNNDSLERGDKPHQKYYKIYRGDSIEGGSSYTNILPSPVKSNKKNRIYLTVLVEKESGKKLTKESYQHSVYDLETNRLLISSPISPTQNEDLVINRIRSALPTLSLGTSIEVKVRGKFNLYDLQIDEYSLYDIIINDDIFKNYLFVNETNKPYPNKKRIGLQYKSLIGENEEGEIATGEGYIRNTSSVKTTLKPLEVPEKTERNTFYQLTPEGKELVDLPSGTPLIQVRISRADSRLVVQRFMEVFRRLMSIYKQEKEVLDSYYHLFIPNLYDQPNPTPAQPITALIPPEEGFLSPAPQRIGPGAPLRKGNINKIDYLKQLAPDLFVNKYARQCQAKFQPLIIPPDEVQKWKDQTFVHKGVVTQRQIMEFPPKNPKYLFVCSNDKAPFPGVKVNEGLSNEEEYPYIPCCFTTDQMSNPNSKYNHYYQGKKKKIVQQTRVSHKMKRNKILAPGRIGIIPKTINGLLQRYSEQAHEFNRLGVPRSVNSLIHCILVALQNPEYLALTSIEEREAFAHQIRQEIHRSVHPSLMKQELFDVTDEDILAQIADEKVFFDPQLFYRSLEELFNVNIYVFIPAEEEDRFNRLEIPRYKFFHSRPLRDRIPRIQNGVKEIVIRPTVIIYKHYGATSEISNYPQCELIVNYNDETKTSINSFGPSMTRLLHTTLLDVLKTITWTIENPPASEVESDLQARSNIYSRVDFYQIIGRKGLGQILDGYGKLRALVFNGPRGPLMMAIPPSQPENLPLIQKQINGNPSSVIDIFGEPSGITMTTNGEVSGYWYPVMDLLFGIYFPVELTTRFNQKTIGPPNPIFTTGINVVDRIQRLQKSLDLFWQLLKWLFILAQVRSPLIEEKRKPVLPDEFANRYFAITEERVQDSARFYDFSGLKRKLPIVSSVEEALSLMTEEVPTMFSRGKIIFYSSGFAQKMRQHLEEFYYLTSPLPIQPIFPGLVEDWTLPTEIDNYYREASDFRSQDAVAVFIGETDFFSWLSSISRPSHNSIVIKNKLDISLGLLDEPYIYLDTSGKIYLIQNVIGGSFDRAINVAATWLAARVNLGLFADPYTEKLPVHVIYSISASSHLAISEDRSFDSPVYLEILLYGEGVQLVREEGKLIFKREEGQVAERNRRYAAMLPLF